MMRQIVFALLGLILALPGYAKFTATVDNKSVVMGHSLTLTLTTDNLSSFAEPDLSALELNFEVLGKSSQQSTQIINGKISASKQWFVTITPKREGKAEIPALTLNNESTHPITITAFPYGSKAKDALPQDDLLIETEVDKQTPSISEQVIYAVKVFVALDASIDNLILNDPDISGASFTTLDKDLRYQVRKNNKRYQVIERRYAVFPEQSGPLVIKGGSLSGSRILTHQHKPGGNALFNDPFFSTSIFQKAEPFRLPVPDVELEVTAALSSIVPWLPAEDLTVRETWQTDSKSRELKVGEPVTRTIVITAKGLTAAQIPQLSKPVLGVSEYPNAAQLDNIAAVDGVTGTRTEAIAYVAKTPGKITFPALSLRWWDTKTKTVRVAKIVSQRFTVTAAAGSSNTTASTPTTPQVASLPISGIMQPPESGLWQKLLQYGGWFLALVFALLYWLKPASNRQSPRKADTETTPEPLKEQTAQQHASKQDIKSACLANDPQKAARLILAYNSYPFINGVKPRSLTELANKVQQHSQGRDESISAVHSALAKLEQCIYKAPAPTWDGTEFWQQFSGIFKLKSDVHINKKNEQTSLWQKINP